MGDSAYPILTHIQKLFDARMTKTANQNAYDENMKKGQVQNNNAFGILKNKWFIL